MALPPDLPPAPILDDPRRRVDRQAAREVIGMIAAVVGLVALGLCAFAYDRLAGYTYLSLLTTLTGIALMYDRGV